VNRQNAFDLVLFDLDGTLVDTLPDIAAALAATLEPAAVPVPEMGTVKELVGDGARALIRRALARAHAERDLDALYADFLAHYRAHVSDRSTVFDGVTDALAALAAAGMTVAVLTNKPGDIARRLLDDVGLGGRFRRVVGDGDGFPRKPDPTAARALIAEAQTTVTRTALVGDGLPDMRTANALGATGIAAAWGYTTAEALSAETPTLLARTPLEAARFLLDGRPR
jgi:phosphoglycolate phosphatase